MLIKIKNRGFPLENLFGNMYYNQILLKVEIFSYNCCVVIVEKLDQLTSFEHSHCNQLTLGTPFLFKIK